jgi:hypothetical protein
MFYDFIAQTDNTVAAVGALVSTLVGVIVLTLSSFFKVYSLYDRHWSRRHHKILRELRAVDTSQSPFTRYLDEAIYLESYRIASGVRANRIKADFLLRSALTGHWNHRQIRQIARFVVVSPESPKPALRITAWDTAGARASLFIGMIIMAIGCMLGFAVAVKGSTLSAYCAGGGLVFVFIIDAALVMSNYNSYNVARRFNVYMNDHPEIFDDGEHVSSQERPIE